MADSGKAQDYLKLISEASKILSGSPELIPSLNDINKFIASNFADWCSIDLIDETGNIQSVSQAPKKKPTVIGSKLIVPLTIKGQTIGNVTFVNSPKSRKFTREDHEAAKELATRIALDIANARIYHHLEKAIKIREEFISIASHELKTPLTTLKGFTQILRQHLQSQPEVSYLSKMENQLDRLNSLVSSLLDVSRIQRGKLELQKEKFDLKSLILEQIENLQATNPKHRIMLQNTPQKSVFADKYRLSQVLVNLISNAIKYSPKADKIIIRLAATRQFITVKVQDFGIGIDEKKFDKIFEPFYQADNTIRQSFSGLGLGLYICHEIIQRHGGKIWVNSKKGEGSIFSFRLPKEQI